MALMLYREPIVFTAPRFTPPQPSGPVPEEAAATRAGDPSPPALHPAPHSQGGPSASLHPTEQLDPAPPSEPPLGSARTPDLQVVFYNLKVITDALAQTRSAAEQLESSRQQVATVVAERDIQLHQLQQLLAARDSSLRTLTETHTQLLRDHTALLEQVQALQADLISRVPAPDPAAPSIRRLELEATLSARLQQADSLFLENQQLRTELALQTLPPRELSRAVREYAATKQRDFEHVLTAYRADLDCQHRWLSKFEARDPTFEPWLEVDDPTSTLPTEAPPTVHQPTD